MLRAKKKFRVSKNDEFRLKTRNFVYEKRGIVCSKWMRTGTVHLTEIHNKIHNLPLILCLNCAYVFTGVGALDRAELLNLADWVFDSFTPAGKKLTQGEKDIEVARILQSGAICIRVDES